MGITFAQLKAGMAAAEATSSVRDSDPVKFVLESDPDHPRVVNTVVADGGEDVVIPEDGEDKPRQFLLKE